MLSVFHKTYTKYQVEIMESVVQRSQKSCSLCENAVYSTVETYATHLQSSDHLDKLKAIKNDKEMLSQRFECSLFIIRE